MSSKRLILKIALIAGVIAGGTSGCFTASFFNPSTPGPLALTDGIDTAAPTVTIITPTGPLKGGATVALTFSATDTGGLASLTLQYSDDGTTYASVATLATTASTYSWTVPSSNVATAKLKLVAVDADGNSASATSDAFTVDSTGPVLTLPVPTGTIPTLAGTVRAGRKVSLSLSATDTNGIASLNLQYAADGTTFVSVAALSTSATSYTWTVPGSSSSLAAAKLKLTAVDQVGNSSSTTTAAFSVLPCQVVFYNKRNLDATVDNGAANSVSNVWTINADGTSLQALTAHTMANTETPLPQLSPDGSKIVFYSKRSLTLSDTNGGTATSSYNIWIINADGTGLQALTQVTAASAASTVPIFSPDGTKIYFTSQRSIVSPYADSAASPLVRNVWVMNADGTGLQPLTLTTTLSADSFAPTSISPDGTKMVYLSKRNFSDPTNNAAAVNAVSNLWIANTDGTGALPLTQFTTEFFQAPMFSVDGTKVLYSSNRKLDLTAGVESSVNLWVVNLDGTGNIPLTSVTGAGASVASVGVSLSPGGLELFFGSYRDIGGSLSAAGAVGNLWKMTLNALTTTGVSTPFTQITAAGADTYAPVRLVDKLIYQSKRNLTDLSAGAAATNNYNIWIANADGTGTHTPLTRVTVSDSSLPMTTGSVSASCKGL